MVTKAFAHTTLVLFAAILSTGLISCGSPAPPSPKVPAAPLREKANVIVFLADALRADRVHCYGYDLPTTPAMDSLAERGFLFENCYAQSSWTKPSIASFLTGRMPSVHQVAVAGSDAGDATKRAQVLRESFLTLGEVFQQAGYATAMFMMNSLCQKEYGFAQGFDHYWYKHFASPEREMNEALAWLDQPHDKPFFMYIHIRDPHQPYEAPDEAYQTLFGKPLTGNPRDMSVLREFGKVYAAWANGKASADGLSMAQLSPGGKRLVSGCYDAEVLQSDRQLRRLLDRLDQLGLRANTTIVAVADHGEEIWDHGDLAHGRTLYEEVLRVPLIISPAGCTQATRVASVVRMFDLYPTLPALCRIPCEPNRDSQTLFDPATGALAATANRIAFSELGQRDNPDEWARAMVDGPRKLILQSAALLGPTATPDELSRAYDLAQDPKESAPNKHISPQQHSDMDRQLADAVGRWKHEGEPFGPPQWDRLDEETRQNLNAIGYLP